jgi:hypothetical protein
MLGQRFRSACRRHELDGSRRPAKLDCTRFQPPGNRQLGLGF